MPEPRGPGQAAADWTQGGQWVEGEIKLCQSLEDKGKQQLLTGLKASSRAAGGGRD